MATFDQMIIDDRELANRYFGDDALNDEQYLFSNLSTNNRRPLNNNGSDDTGLFGRRVYLESPSLGNRDEDEIYRYVPSRLSERQAVGPVRSSEALIDSLDLELNVFGATNTRPPLPYRPNPQLHENFRAPAPLTQMTNPARQPVSSNLPRSDPRQDPLLGPLLAELDALTTHQPSRPAPAPPIPIYRRNSFPYEPSLPRTTASQTRSNYALPNTANRTVADALLEAELYDSLDNRDAQIPSYQSRQALPVSAPNLNSAHPPLPRPPPPQQQQQQPQRLPPRSSNMNSTDIFMPSSYSTGPGSFLSHFGPDDQLFQQPMLNAMGQNYVPNARPPPQSQQPQSQQPQYEQADPIFDNSFSRVSPPQQRSTYAPPQRPPNNNKNPYQQQQPPPPPPPANRQTPHDNMDPFSEYHDMYASSQQQRTLPSLQQRPPQPQGAGQQQYYEGSKQAATYPPSNREMFFTDHDEDQLDQLSYRQQQPGPSGTNTQRSGGEHHEQDSRRQAVWNELQRNNAKVQEKNAKKRESANRREQLLKGHYSSNNGPSVHAPQQSSAPAKSGGNPPAQRRPPPVPVPKTNYIDDNIDMIRNKESFYHRYPAKKYENLYSKRKDLGGGGQNPGKKDSRDGSQGSPTDFDQTQSAQFATHANNSDGGYADPKHRTSLPVTVNLNPGQSSQSGGLPATVTIPLDSHVNRVGDKISVNIDLRLVDLQNLKQQQQQNAEHPDWSGLDPLDRHIRKLERSIDQSLPQTYSPTQRSPTQANPGAPTSMGRYGKMTTGGVQAGYAPPTHGGDHYSYSDKGREEDSYLAKMNHMKRGPNFKPYNGRDYEQFKKNYGYGGGNLGFDFDNPNYKEKSDKLVKTKEYAQQVEARNKKKLTDAPRRTLSDTRIPTEASKTQRALEYARVSTRHKQTSDASTRSTPPDMNGHAAGGPSRRPTEVLHRPPAVQRTTTKPHPNDNNELVERLALRHEQDKAQVHGILHPTQKRREPLFDDDRGVSEIERLAQDRVIQRRVSPPKPLPPSNNSNGRRPLRFDEAPVSSHEPSYPPARGEEHHRPVPAPARLPSGARSIERTPQRSGPPRQQDNVDELANRHNDEKMLMEAIRRELSERPLGDDEELIVVEQ